MTSSPDDLRETEARIYWDACGVLAAARRGVGDMSIEDALDEIGAIGELTDWPALRIICGQLVATVRAEENAKAARVR